MLFKKNKPETWKINMKKKYLSALGQESFICFRPHKGRLREIGKIIKCRSLWINMVSNKVEDEGLGKHHKDPQKTKEGQVQWEVADNCPL